MTRWIGSFLTVVVASCTVGKPEAVATPRVEDSIVIASPVALADGRVSFREGEGAFVIDYPATWQWSSQDHFRIVNATPGYPKATVEIFPSGKQSYRAPSSASTLQIQTGFGALAGYQFKAPDVYGGAPYYAEVISANFRAGGHDWAVEAVLLEQRREETLSIVLDFLRTLRSPT
jgi:hypothetical protein